MRIEGRSRFVDKRRTQATRRLATRATRRWFERPTACAQALQPLLLAATTNGQPARRRRDLCARFHPTPTIRKDAVRFR